MLKLEVGVNYAAQNRTVFQKKASNLCVSHICNSYQAVMFYVYNTWYAWNILEQSKSAATKKSCESWIKIIKKLYIDFF